MVLIIDKKRKRQQARMDRKRVGTVVISGRETIRRSVKDDK